MKPSGFLIMIGLGFLSVQGIGQVSSRPLMITYLYDNTAVAPGTKADWGFACLMDGNGKQLLFDTGAKADVLRSNVAALHVDLASIDAVVFSHEHGDHIGGLDTLVLRPGIPVFFPASFGEATRAAIMKSGLKLVPSSKAAAVLQGFATSDEMGTQIHEQALVVETSHGLVVIVGCAHPGIISMLKQITESRKRPIHMVIGGFHLLQTPQNEIQRIVGEFNAMGIAYAGPTHCSGDEALKQFRAAYGSHFITGGVGTMVKVPATEMQ